MGRECTGPKRRGSIAWRTRRGPIVIATDPFGNTPNRPYLILSNDQVPFYGQEYVVAVITTTKRTEAVELTSDCYERGELPRLSYVSPWSVLVIKDWMITKQPAEATDAIVDTARQKLATYLQTG